MTQTDLRPQDTLQRALAAHQAGNLVEAEQLCNAILNRNDAHPVALHMLGLIEQRRGKSANAVRLIDKALAVRPDYVEALVSRGNILCTLGRPQEALTNCYDRALSINPDNPEVLYNRGYALQLLDRHEDALASYDRALAINPNIAQAHNNRGNVLFALEHFQGALESYDRALAIKPDDADILNNHGSALSALGHLQEALASYDRALASKPNYVDALYNRGGALFALGRLQEVLGCYDQLLAIKPDHVDALNNRAGTLGALGRLQEAIESYDHVLAIKPDHVDALYGRGNVLREVSHWQAAIENYGRALELKADHAAVRFALCMAQLPVIYTDELEIATRRTAYEQCLTAFCEAVDRGEALGDLAAAVGRHKPFFLAYQGHNDRDLQARYGSLVCRIMADRYPPAQLAAPLRPNEPVRVGIVSGHFYRSAAWKVQLKGWITQLDRRQFRVLGYYTGIYQDDETKLAVAQCDRFIQGTLSIDRWRQTILADAPHVLIYPELGLDAVSAALAAQRLAPVQCNAWGHPQTSGYPTLDYFLGGDLMEPPDAQNHYTERLIRLPNLGGYYAPFDAPPLAITRTEIGLRPAATAFWCGQSLPKYLPQFDQVFPRIVRAAGDCQFVFFEYFKGAYITELFRQRLDRAFAALGLQAADHCIILPRLDFAQYVAIFEQCDIFLDSIGFSGGNTTLESLSHDLPIVTMRTALMRGRQSFGILKMMGVTETVTETVDDYVAVAGRLVRDVPWRLAVKQRMAENKHKVYRDRSCIAALEEFLNRVAGGAPLHRN